MSRTNSVIRRMRYIALFFLFTLTIDAYAQQDTAKHGTIVVKKKGKKKTLFDQVNERLILVDPHGTIIDTADVSFDMVMEKDGHMITLTASTNYLTKEMQEYMQVAQDGTVFYFKNVKLKNKKGDLESYPSTVVKVDAEFYKKRKNKRGG